MADKNSALDYYLNLANNISDFTSAADLIIKVIESPTIYSFSEILEVPFISSVNNFNFIFNSKQYFYYYLTI